MPNSPKKPESSKKSQKKVAEEKNLSLKKGSAVESPSPVRSSKQKKRDHKEQLNEKKEKKATISKKAGKEAEKISSKKAEKARKAEKSREVEVMEEKKKVEEEKKLQPSLSTEIVGEKKIDTPNGKKMEEEVLDDELTYPYFHKHPMLFAVFIPDNTNREIIYVNKKLFIIARRHTADYVITDRRVSNDGIRISVKVEYDRAEISARRFSASSVYVNDVERLECNWTPLFNGDTLTFADGSRYTFYNIYNQRDLDEIIVDENSIVRYVRKNMLDENEKPLGYVSVLSKETNFDAIDHSHDNVEVVSEEQEIEDIDEDIRPETSVLVDKLIPGLIPGVLGTPSDNIEVSDSSDEKEVKDAKAIQKELLENVSTLNSMIGAAVKDDDAFVHHVNEKENPFDDGDGGVVEMKRPDERRLIDVLLTDRRKNLPSLDLTEPLATSNLFSLVPSRHGNEKRHEKHAIRLESSNRMSGSVSDYEDRAFIVYRSKNKLMPSTCDVYDIVVDAFFREMMEGIDLDDIKALLTQNTKNQNSHYRQLIRETVEQGIITPEKNPMTFDTCGYHVTESFQRYCSLLFQSYISNTKYVTGKENESKHAYPPQFVRMSCENGRQYVNNIILSLAHEQKADMITFNYKNNILIEGTPLCYRKYLFGLFPSTVHIKPSLQAIPKRRVPEAVNRTDSYEEIVFDDPYFTMIDDEGMEEEEDDGMSEGDDESLEIIDDEYGDEDGAGTKVPSKEEDEILEGDIVVVSPMSKEPSNVPHLLKTKQPVLIHYPRSIPLAKLPDTPKHKDKERRAVVVKVLGKRLIIRYLDKDDTDDRSLSIRLSRRSIDLTESPVPDRESKKRAKNQALARSLHSCPRSLVRKWVDEEDQKFILMKCVNDIIIERNESMKQMDHPQPLFIVFEDAPLLIKRRNANILSLLNVHDKVFSYPLFIILTEKSHGRPQTQNNVMMLGGLSMLMRAPVRQRSNDGRSHIEQYFDSMMERAFTLPYSGIDLTLQTDIIVIDVPVPIDNKFKYSYEKKVEEDDRIAMRVKHVKELEFFLRAHHLYCPEIDKVRYLDLKRIKNWLSIIRMAYSLQAGKGLHYVREDEIYDVYNKSKDSIVRTGKPVYVSENPGDTLYAVIDRKCLEYALKVSYNTQKESQPDSSQEIRTRNESEKRLLSNGSLISPNNITVGFDDVGSLENVKAKLREAIVLPLRRPEIFAQSSLLKSCKGLLLFGPPGTGKTMLAKALARESGANFLSIATSTIFNKYVGESEQNTRAIFTLAARLSPCVIFIDEIDSILSVRSSGSSGEEYTRKVKNEFMSCWDGLLTDENLRVVVIGCTNRPFDLDDAVLRRFTRKLLVDLPDADQREKILKVILRKEKLDDDVDLKAIASDAMTKGFSGSDLYNLCQAAAYMPVREIVAKEEAEPAKSKEPKMDSMGLLSLDEEDENDGMEVENKEEIKVRPLTMKDFEKASKEITFSFEESNSVIRAIREWNEKYGDSGSRKSDDLSYYI